MATLMDIVNVAHDDTFQARVQAATALLGLPFHPNQVMHVASQVDVDGGAEGVADAAILAALAPVDADPYGGAAPPVEAAPPPDGEAPAPVTE